MIGRTQISGFATGRAACAAGMSCTYRHSLVPARPLYHPHLLWLKRLALNGPSRDNAAAESQRAAEPVGPQTYAGKTRIKPELAQLDGVALLVVPGLERGWAASSTAARAPHGRLVSFDRDDRLDAAAAPAGAACGRRVGLVGHGPAGPGAGPALAARAMLIWSISGMNRGQPRCCPGGGTAGRRPGAPWLSARRSSGPALSVPVPVSLLAPVPVLLPAPVPVLLPVPVPVPVLLPVPVSLPVLGFLSFGGAP